MTQIAPVGRPRKSPDQRKYQAINLNLGNDGELFTRLDTMLDKINEGGGKYIPPLSRNALIKMFIMYGLDNIDKIYKPVKFSG